MKRIGKSPGKTGAFKQVKVHTLVIGSGAAGLNAAVQLRANGVEDVMILTEGLKMGTSINTGSDKQTYYKLSLYGKDTDAPAVLAETFFNGGSMHGDLALVEASLSARAFLHLVNLGVMFPRDAHGQFVGYKTDHDPRQRATSIGPYTSREMCRALIRRVKELGVEVREGRNVVELVVVEQGGERRAAGCIAVDARGRLESYVAENVVLAVGGPGGLYRASVYPRVHTGGIGLGLMAGAAAQSLPESQYGLASTKFRWNVSGTYMQVIPKFISTSADGKSDQREFMREYFDSVGQMNANVFLKGYQWPFDSRKIPGGSSIVDILVYIETVRRGRRVFLDFRGNPDGFRFEDLGDEALTYLKRSDALLETPIARLKKMNPGAIQLYRDHGINIEREPLEIAVCAQHNNGGLAANHWWESLNVKHLFPVGEVNGSHGVYRPGGSALNSGQVAGFRAAEYIANRYAKWSLPVATARRESRERLKAIAGWMEKCRRARRSWRSEREEFQDRMSRAGAHIRPPDDVKKAAGEAWVQYRRIEDDGCSGEVVEALRNRQMCLAHAVYLEAIKFAQESGIGSRGSSITLMPAGTKIHGKLDDSWRIQPEDPAFREKVQETVFMGEAGVEQKWVARRAMPDSNAWFETAWAAFREGSIYG